MSDAAGLISILNQLNLLDLKLDALAEAQRREAAIAFLERRVNARNLKPVAEGTAKVPEPLPHSLDEQFSHLRVRAPLNFDSWLDRFNAGAREYEKRDRASLSVIDHPEAFHFGRFIDLHGQGNLLDIGVGPLAIPSYLWRWPAGHLAGLDPLPSWEPHPFPFARSVAEFIPWPDQTFDTVVAGTSLDHIYLLDVAFAEIRRVLKPGGRLLIWSAIFAETPAYDPYSAAITPPDAYHLFHPGENWFMGALDQHFRLIERMDVSLIGFANSYLALEARG